jgi:hypothetical protein
MPMRARKNIDVIKRQCRINNFVMNKAALAGPPSRMPIQRRLIQEYPLSIHPLRTMCQGAHDIVARDNPQKPVFCIQDRKAPDSVLDHQLQHPREFRGSFDIDEFRCHDVGYCLFHQCVIAWNHAGWRKGKAFQKIEFGHEADNVVVFLDRKSIEVILLEYFLEIAHQDVPRNGRHRTRHVFSGGRLEESMHGMIFS